MQRGFNLNLALDQATYRPGTHPHARHGTVRDIDDIRAGFCQQAGPRQQFVGRETAWGLHLNRDGKCLVFQGPRQAGWPFDNTPSHFRLCFWQTGLANFDRFRCSFQRFRHRLDVLRSCTAAPSNQADPGIVKRKRILRKIIWTGRVHDPPRDLFREPSIRHHGEPGIRHLGLHLGKNTEKLRRAARAIYPNQIRTGLLELPGHLGRSVPQQGPVIAGKGHRGDHRQVADLMRSRDGLNNLEQVADGLYQNQVGARPAQSLDLLRINLTCLGRLNPTKRRQPDAQGPNVAGHQHLATGYICCLPSQFYTSTVDILQFRFQVVLSELETVRAECIGEKYLGTGFDISLMDLQNCLGIRKVNRVKMAEREASSMQHRTHGAIRQQGSVHGFKTLDKF